MELKIDSERVLEAANKCGQTKEVMKTLFPQLFEENKEIDLRLLQYDNNNHRFIETSVFKSTGVKYANLLWIDRKDRFTLSRFFKWKLVENKDYCELIPTRR